MGPHGAKHCAIDAQAKGVTGRGVLIDVARYRGVDWLEKGEVISPDDLDGALARQGTQLRPGFLCAPPIKFRRAVGSPINPLAIK